MLLSKQAGKEHRYTESAHGITLLDKAEDIPVKANLGKTVNVSDISNFSLPVSASSCPGLVNRADPCRVQKCAGI